MQKWIYALLAPAVPALLAGCVAHSTPSVPANEVSAHTPDMLRQLLSGRVRVSELARGQFAGAVIASLYDADGTSRACSITSGNSASGTWTVVPDANGRATFSVTNHGTALARRTYVMRYDPGTGAFDSRRRGSGKAWVTSSRGWLQDRWPQAAVDKCGGMNLRGVGVDERQTARSLAGLRRQTPDAPLKNLVQPLPPPGAKRSAAPASRALAKTPPLTAKDLAGLLAMGVPERYLPAFEDQLVTPAAWARLVERGFTPAHVAELAAQDTASRARNAELQVVSAGDGAARLRSWMGHWDVREGERVSDIGRVSRITPGGAVWLQGMAEPLPGAAR